MIRPCALLTLSTLAALSLSSVARADCYSDVRNSYDCTYAWDWTCDQAIAECDRLSGGLGVDDLDLPGPSISAGRPDSSWVVNLGLPYLDESLGLLYGDVEPQRCEGWGRLHLDLQSFTPPTDLVVLVDSSLSIGRLN